MTDEPLNHTLEYPRRMEDKIDRLLIDVQDLKARLSRLAEAPHIVVVDGETGKRPTRRLTPLKLPQGAWGGPEL